ncbi:hypothetical protein, partial [Pseudonocardia sp. McavD-2-B]|uniref:hypothetical protein n=1 Tax=Pseudonocardia sp. McavD-2-B TaxID=2954499 RepID=UPI002096AF13
DLVAASGNAAPLVDAVEVSGIEGAQEAAADDHGHDHDAGATPSAAQSGLVATAHASRLEASG